MSADTETLIAQARKWLDEDEPGMRVEVLLNLPDINWVELKELRDQGALLDLVYRGQTLSTFLQGFVELTCDRAAIQAVRRRKETSLEGILGPAED